MTCAIGVMIVLHVAAVGIPYVIGFFFIINEELFTGTKVLIMHPPSN